MAQPFCIPPVQAIGLDELASLVNAHAFRSSVGLAVYQDLRKQLERLTQASTSPVKLSKTGQITLMKSIMRQICLDRMPLSRTSYYNLVSCSANHIDYVSMGVSWDGFSEVRGPRPLNGMKVKEARLSAGRKLYVLESDFEFWLWFKFWKTEAIISKGPGDKYLQSG